MEEASTMSVAFEPSTDGRSSFAALKREKANSVAKADCISYSEAVPSMAPSAWAVVV